MKALKRGKEKGETGTLNASSRETILPVPTTLRSFSPIPIFVVVPNTALSSCYPFFPFCIRILHAFLAAASRSAISLERNLAAGMLPLGATSAGGAKQPVSQSAADCRGAALRVFSLNQMQKRLGREKGEGGGYGVPTIWRLGKLSLNLAELRSWRQGLAAFISTLRETGKS